MKVILVQDVTNLGVLGDQVQVKDGYARNFLIPQGKAILASSKKSKELQHRMQFFEKLRQAAIESANGEAAKLISKKWEVQKKSGPGGRLFGSVTNSEIASLLQDQGFEVTRRNVVPYEPIKTVGTHKVSVKLHTEVKVDIDINVIADLVEPEATAGGEGEVAEDQAQSAETEESEESVDSEETAEAVQDTETAS
ncbi:MAG: 50S ribosomal protein L9 [SAR324 cluster bacterium]|nr:50S ribosomal protein L9 [SAR324 cluster bacterium]